MCANTKTAGLIPFVLKGAQPGCFSAANRLEQKKKKKHFAWALIGVCCFSLWFEASACSEDPRHVLGNQSPSCLAGRSRADITLKPKLKGFSRALSCMCSGWLMFEWDFISNSCLCSLIPVLLGGTLLYRLPFWCFRAAPKHPRLVCYSKHIIHHSEKSIKRTITSEKIGPLLRARDGCLSRLSQGEGCRKLLMRLKKICVHSGGKEFVIRLLQSVKLLSHSVRNMKNLPRNTLSSFFNTCSLKRHCRIQFFSGILQVQVFLVLLGECSGAFFITLLWLTNIGFGCIARTGLIISIQYCKSSVKWSRGIFYPAGLAVRMMSAKLEHKSYTLRVTVSLHCKSFPYILHVHCSVAPTELTK